VKDFTQVTAYRPFLVRHRHPGGIGLHVRW
jgi:hypothetical protein